jgi:hypothetical protein
MKYEEKTEPSESLNKLETEEDADKLYQEFKADMLKRFRDGEEPDGHSEEIIDFIMKRTNLNKDDSFQVAINFMDVMLTDTTIDLTEKREEKL